MQKIESMSEKYITLEMGISYSMHLLCALSTMCTLSTSSQGDGSSMIACGAIQGQFLKIFVAQLLTFDKEVSHWTDVEIAGCCSR